MSNIQEALLAHPAVEAVAAFELPDRDDTPTKSVCISIKSDQNLELAEIQQWARARCNADELPGRWLFINQMPRRTDGSIDTEMLRELVAGTRR